jgi:carbamoyltransferase
MEHFRIDADGVVHGDFRSNSSIKALMREIVAQSSREDAAASLQQVLEDVMLNVTTRLLARHPARRLGVAGGVFANVRPSRFCRHRPRCLSTRLTASCDVAHRLRSAS